MSVLNDIQSSVVLPNVSQQNENLSTKNSLISTKRNDRKKQLKKGIVYLSTIPPFMNVTKVTEIMSQYGDVGRVFLQPAKSKHPGKRPAKHFTEGWIEFLSKTVAKQVAAKLNNTLIGGRKKSRYYDYIWNLKYLPRFKWVHLNERLEYERAVLKQRLKTESEQAKRESSHFARSVEISEKLQKARSKKASNNINKEENDRHNFIYKQRKTEEEIKSKKNQTNSEERAKLLTNIFVS